MVNIISMHQMGSISGKIVQLLPRKILQRLMRNRVLQKSIKVKRGSEILWKITPDSQLKYLKRNFDRELKLFVEKHVKLDDQIWDIGANCGTFTAFCLSLGVEHKILAVEPDQFLSNILLMNSFKYNITPLSCAVSDSSGVTDLCVAQQGRASNSISDVVARSSQGGVRYLQPTLTVTLDFLAAIYGTPSIVKIDIEGAEALALKGASNILSAQKARFLIEVDKRNIDEVMKIFKDHNYLVEEIFEENFLFTPK